MARLFEVDYEADTDDWYTPAWVFEGLGLRFDLDVAAPPGGVPWVPADSFYTESDDGLLQPWFGLVWCNPPYSAPTAWCDRWAEHSDGLLLVRADLSTGGPFRAFRAADAVWVPKGRLGFVNGFGGRSPDVTFSSVLLGRGVAAVGGMRRLEAAAGGCVRRLV